MRLIKLLQQYISVAMHFSVFAHTQLPTSPTHPPASLHTQQQKDKHRDDLELVLIVLDPRL